MPFLSKCYYNNPAKYKLSAMDAALQEVLTFLGRTPWWAARPERHIFFFMSGIGAGSVPSWRTQIAKAIFVVAEGDRQAEYFREGHDIVVPGKISTKHKARQVDPSDRSIIASFRGSLDAALRDAEGGEGRAVPPRSRPCEFWLSVEAAAAHDHDLRIPRLCQGACASATSCAGGSSGCSRARGGNGSSAAESPKSM